MPTPKLEPAAIEQALTTLAGWSIQNDKLHKQFTFPDFSQAIGFMTTAAIRIEKLDHHPEWSNVYNRVTVDLTTHDSGGITAKDVQLAHLLESLAAKFIGEH